MSRQGFVVLELELKCSVFQLDVARNDLNTGNFSLISTFYRRASG